MQAKSLKHFFLNLIIVILGACFSFPAFANIDASVNTFEAQLKKLELEGGGRIGVYAIDTANTRSLDYRGAERFPMGCTSKVIGVAAILKRSMLDRSLLNEKITYSRKDLTNWWPITKKHLTTGMSVSELCAAAISYSDNSAMNLLVKKLGGLQHINAFARTLHDPFFRQDHDWPSEAKSGGIGNLEDSSTPNAMANNLKQLTLGNVLAHQQRQLLLSWLKANTTGDARIRAGVPAGWIVGDKTGTGSFYGTTNDIGIIWPPHCSPLIVAIYYTHENKGAVKHDDVIAKTTRILINEFAKFNTCIKLNMT